MPPELDHLLSERGKHTQYQEIHPALRKGFGLPDAAHAERRDSTRQAFFASALDYAGKRVLDIGSNTGYFAVEAVLRGACRVECREGYLPHARFLEAVAARLDLGERWSVTRGYHDFDTPADERFDLCFCLNVLHHLGDDFGDPDVSLPEAKRLVAKALDGLAATCDTLVLQLGFNWKGDPDTPLFGSGRKREMVEFVTRAAAPSWNVERIVALDAEGGSYRDLDASNTGRFDALGEFANRPLFVLTAKGGHR